MLIARMTAILFVIFSSTLQVRADGDYEDLYEYSFFGEIFVLPGEQNIAWLFGEIENGDYFNFRRMLRRHEIDTLVLGSPGGSVSESLQIAAMVHDLNISTYIPTGAVCASACANIFFAGPSRHADGQLGVHQFYTTSNTGSLDEVQFTVSEILGFLNEFDTPPMVYERMFESGDMFYFSDDDLLQINRDQNRDSSRRLSAHYRSSLQEIYQAVLVAVGNYEEDQGGDATNGSAPAPTTPAMTQAQRQTLLAEWGGQIMARIERARPRVNAAGQVTLSLRISRDGSLGALGVARSSGNPDLDAAAMDAVRRVGRFPAAPNALREASYAFNLPIRFR